MTFGYELEVGDVFRERTLPRELGVWEFSETDVINIQEPYRYVACDPLGLEPPMGGEINIKPGHTVEEVADRVAATVDWFRSQGDQPFAGCISHGHVHVRIPGLRKDMVALKRLMKWIGANQETVVRTASKYVDRPSMHARAYLKYDGGRLMPQWMIENILTRARSFDDFIRLHCCGKDGVSMGRPFRYAINTYCMKHIDTIEFRFFRCTIKHNEILGSLQFARDVLASALDGGKFDPSNYVLPPYYYDHDQVLGWEATRWDKKRGKKMRRLYDI